MKERVRERRKWLGWIVTFCAAFISLLHSIMTAEVNAAHTDLKTSTRLLIYRARMMDYEQRRYLIWSSCMNRFEFEYTQLFPFCANKFSSYFGCQPQARYPIICKVSFFNWAPFRSIKTICNNLIFYYCIKLRHSRYVNKPSTRLLDAVAKSFVNASSFAWTSLQSRCSAVNYWRQRINPIYKCWD